MCYIQETHLTCKDTHRLKIKGWRKIYQPNEDKTKTKTKTKKTAGAAILASDIIDFRATKTKRDHLHNGKRINATRRAKDSKYIHTQYRSTQIYKVSS